MEKATLLRALKNAERRHQIGLFIWPNWQIFDDLFHELDANNTHYQFALHQLKNGNEATITINWNGFNLPGVIAVPVKKLLKSEDAIVELLKICEIGHYTGPISMVPANETFK